MREEGMDAVNKNERMPYRREYANNWPCAKDCPERHTACHAECKKYIKAKEENDRKKAELQKKKRDEAFVNSYIAKRVSETTGKPLKQR